MSPSITCERLSVSFNGTAALADVSLDFHVGKIVALVGPNGAGKTTLLNVVTGYCPADAGICRWGNEVLTGLSPFRIARLGIARTFQDLRIVTRLTALENLLLAVESSLPTESVAGFLRWRQGARSSPAEDMAREGLERLGLGASANLAAGSLSYGQQKLLALACCGAREAEFFFLDEPVAGVHPEMIERIGDVLIDFKNKGKSVVFVEHELKLVRQLADHVVVMDSGQVLAEGSAEDVLNLPLVLEAFVG